DPSVSFNYMHHECVHIGLIRGSNTQRLLRQQSFDQLLHSVARLLRKQHGSRRGPSQAKEDDNIIRERLANERARLQAVA
ncbi:MAG: hypothetical protein ACK56F_01565, partial [bacterium]